jgi:hypothetical protein
MSVNSSLQDADRDFFLGVYRAAVDFYKPRIEKKTGVALGEISVWDYECLLQHQLDFYAGKWLIRTIRKYFFTRTYDLQMDSAKRWHEESATKCCAVYFRNGIYVSFGGDTVHEEAIAVAVVHELSHALWERLAKWPLDVWPRARYRDDYDLFVEGFATYAEREWFLDLYPLAIRESARRAYYDPNGIHHRGFLRIKDLVKRYGAEILPQIPRKWKVLSHATKD